MVNAVVTKLKMGAIAYFHLRPFLFRAITTETIEFTIRPTKVNRKPSPTEGFTAMLSDTNSSEVKNSSESTLENEADLFLLPVFCRATARTLKVMLRFLGG